MARITGILLLPVLLIEYLHQRDFKKENVRKDILWIFVIALGLLIYLIINYVTYGDPGHKITGGWFQIIFGLLGLILTIYSFFRIRLSYSVYALATWLVVTSTSFMISIPRYMLTIFPIFIVLATLGRRKWANYAIIFISLMLYSLFLFQFVRGRWAF
ncbi:MAG: hypothetical protein WD000_05335 [Thermodesulfobacteriota bacterium]